MACSISREDIKQGIQDSVAKSLDNSKLFNRVSPFSDTAERIKNALKYAGDVPDTYRQGFIADPEDFMREIAVQATSSESERQGALDVAGYNLFDIVSEMYVEPGLFAPKDRSSAFQGVINSINKDFGENIIKEENGVYRAVPSEALITTFEIKHTGKDAKYDFSKRPVVPVPLPSTSSPTWQELENKVGTTKAYDEYVRNGYRIPSASGYPESFSGVNATMKVVNALEKIPRSSYPSNQIEGFYNDLRKQGAPEVQINLLKQYISDHNIKEINKVDLITGLLAEMSFTVKINTATRGDNIQEYDPEDITPTQYYSSLTVPGGANYTENEIATPAITPSIKGHAQFSTDNGIGWFRSDDRNFISADRNFYKMYLKEKNVSGEYEDVVYTDDFQEWVKFKQLNANNFENSQVKTRRILEVQSDLYQKSRDIKSPDEIISQLQREGKLKIDCT